MAGKRLEAPLADMTTLTGRFDGLGMDYAPLGEFGPQTDLLSADEQSYRQGLRFVLAEFLGLEPEGLSASGWVADVQRLKVEVAQLRKA